MIVTVIFDQGHAADFECERTTLHEGALLLWRGGESEPVAGFPLRSIRGWRSKP